MTTEMKVLTAVGKKDSHLADTVQVSANSTGQQAGAILRFKDLLDVVLVSKSKAYELMKSDPTFPQGVPLYGGERSPKFYMMSEAMAWIEARRDEFRKRKGH